MKLETALCDYYLQKKSIRCSRHLYDIYKLTPLIKFDNTFMMLVEEVGKDFSQMRKAELRTVGNDFNAEEEVAAESGEKAEGYSIRNARPSMVILPIVVVFVTLDPLGFPFQKVDGMKGMTDVAVTLVVFVWNKKESMAKES